MPEGNGPSVRRMRAPREGGASGRAARRSLADAPTLPVVTNASLQRRNRCKTGFRRYRAVNPRALLDGQCDGGSGRAAVGGDRVDVDPVGALGCGGVAEPTVPCEAPSAF